MDFNELILQRQSTRAYSAQKVEEWKIERCVEAIRLSPSASNSQPWKVVVVDEDPLRQQLAQATFSHVVSFNRFAVDAPVIAVLIIERPKVVTQVGGWLKDREFPLIDIGIAAAHFCLQATELGLGTCMLGWFDEARVKQLLSIPERTRVGLLITLGYGAREDVLRVKVRKTKEKMSGRNRY